MGKCNRNICYCLCCRSSFDPAPDLWSGPNFRSLRRNASLAIIVRNCSLVIMYFFECVGGWTRGTRLCHLRWMENIGRIYCWQCDSRLGQWDTLWWGIAVCSDHAFRSLGTGRRLTRWERRWSKLIKKTEFTEGIRGAWQHVRISSQNWYNTFIQSWEWKAFAESVWY